MTAKTTPNYLINYGWSLGEGPWDAGYNAWAKTVDALMNLSVIDDTLAAPPASPTAGDRYIVAASPTGAWAGKAKSVAYFVDAAWVFYTPKRGWRAEVQSASAFKYYNGTVWTAEPSGGGGGGGISDAPSDGTTYGRKNAAWVAVTGGGGATDLDSLSDVVIGTPANGEVLTYDTPTSKWVNAAVPVASTSTFGTVKPDGTTIAITGGVISAVGGGGGSSTPTGNRNLFVDGAMDRWDVNVGGLGGIGATDTYAADMWITNAGTGGAAVALQKAYMDITDSFRNLGKSPIMPTFYMMHAQTAAATTAPTVGQKLEGVRTLAGQSATLAVNLGSDVGITVTGIQITQNFGTGGSPSATVVTTNAVTWATGSDQARFSVRLDIPTLVGKSIGTNGDDFLRIDLMLPTGATYHLDCGQWQIEQSEATSSSNTTGAGGAPTRFEHRGYQAELSRAQRGLVVLKLAANAGLASGVVLTTTTASGFVSLAAPMRKTPTGVFAGSAFTFVGSLTGGTISWAGSSTSGGELQVTGGTSGTVNMSGYFKAGAGSMLILDARL